jgi:hypothetical protein
MTMQSGDIAIIYVDDVFCAWADAVRRFGESLYDRDSAEARSRFETMFNKYGPSP